MLSPFSPKKIGICYGAKTIFIAAVVLVSFISGFGGALVAVYYTPDFIKKNLGVIERVFVSSQNEEKNGENQNAAYQPQTSQEEQIIIVAKSASPSVVSVVATKDVPVVYSPFFSDPFFEQFFPELFKRPQQQQEKQRKQVSAGTGFVVSDDGLILTNKHVVTDTEADYSVVTTDGKQHIAKVLARDPLEDLALLRVEDIALNPLTLGDSDELQQGQTVIAIGNALGEFDNTVSVGVVSGLRRSIVAGGASMGSEELRELIQTDAAINPGNSGGPLLNLRGEVIGFNVAVARGAENIGFAIPINRAIKAIRQVKETGKISYPFLGVRYMIVDEELKKQYNLSVDYGALVLRGEKITDLAVVPGSPADKAGLVENDIILEVDGEKITVDNPLNQMLANHAPGDAIRLKLLHKGEEKTVQAVLSERQE